MKYAVQALFFLYVLGAFSSVASAQPQPLSISIQKMTQPPATPVEADIARLAEEWRNRKIDRYIPLTKRHVLLLHGGDARPANGIFLADLGSWTVAEYPVLPGDPAIEYVLNDKAGNDAVLIRLDSVMHHGNAGSSYVLLSAAQTRAGGIDFSIQDLGGEIEGEFFDECMKGRHPGESVQTSLNIIKSDVNRDAVEDIKVTYNLIDCGTGKSRPVSKAFIATMAGFVPQELMLPAARLEKSLVEANQQAIAHHRKKRTDRSFRVMEEGGITQILFSKPKEMSESVYVELINNYAFFVSGWRPWLALNLIDDVVTRAPNRAVAWLNRAEVLLSLTRLQPLSPQEIVQFSEDISKSYENYLRRGGVKQPFFDEYSRFNLARYPKGLSVCGFLGGVNPREIRSPAGFFKQDYFFLRSRVLDLNNDGKSERVRLTQARYETYQSAAVITGDNVFPIRKLNRLRDRALNEGFKLLGFEGKTYLVYLTFVTRIDGLAERLVCEAETEPVAHEAKNEAVCAAVLRNEHQYVAFEGASKLMDWKVGSVMLDTKRRAGTAKIDIDNDNSPEIVAAIAGTGGERFDLAVVNISPPALPQNSTNRLLIAAQTGSDIDAACSRGMSSSGCRKNAFWNFDPFTLGNNVYIEKYHMDEFGKTPGTEILEIRNGKVETICRFGWRVKTWRDVGTSERSGG